MKFLKKKIRASHAKYDFRFFFQSALICPILTHFEKKYFFSKCVDLVPNLTHFEFFFKMRNFSKCVVTMREEDEIAWRDTDHTDEIQST